MKIKITVLLITVVFIGIVPAQQQETGTIRLTVTDLRNSRGTVRAFLYDSSVAKKFPRVDYSIQRAHSRIVDSTSRIVFDTIPVGYYSIQILHDEDNNGEMRTNFIGMPKEGIGFSNDAMGRFGPPDFDDARFIIDSGEISITIHAIYL
jgi:uncharacterized protein (DUF2141 family)